MLSSMIRTIKFVVSMATVSTIASVVLAEDRNSSSAPHDFCSTAYYSTIRKIYNEERAYVKFLRWLRQEKDRHYDKNEKHKELLEEYEQSMNSETKDKSSTSDNTPCGDWYLPEDESLEHLKNYLARRDSERPNVHIIAAPSRLVHPKYQLDGRTDDATIDVRLVGPTNRTSSVTNPSLAIELTEFVLDRARREIATRLLVEMSDQLDGTADSAFEAMIFFIEKLNDFDAGEMVSALRVAAAEDLVRISGRLVDMMFADQEAFGYLTDVSNTLEHVRSGGFPWVALSKHLYRHPTEGMCYSNSLAVTSLLAREWTEGRMRNVTLRNQLVERKLSLNEIQMDSEEREIYFTHLLSVLRPHLSEEAHSRQSRQLVVSLFDGVIARLDAAYEAYRGGDASIAIALRWTVDAIEFVDHALCSDESSIYGAVSGVRATPRMTELVVDMYLSAAERRYAELSSHALRFLDYSRSMPSDSQLGPQCGLKAKDCPSVNEGVELRRLALDKMLLFAGAIVQAESSEDVADVLDLFSDPIGSFSTKRDLGLHVTLGSYVGLSAGYEGSERNVFAGAAVPIGIEMGLGTDGCCSVGVFLSPADLGVIASYLISPDDFAQPRIGWQQIFSPSVYFVLGFDEHSPFAVGAGGQYVRGLRTDEEDAFRFGIMLAIDVSLLRLY